jgi:rubrerythrin
MNEMQGLIAKSYRMEMIGTGVYRSLAAQYGKSRPALGARFAAYAEQEFRHGRMFEQCHRKAFGKGLNGGAFWRFMGQVAAFTMRALPLKAKLKKLSRVESQAVADIEQALAGGNANGLEKVLKAILPDEKAHAGLYREWFPN